MTVRQRVSSVFLGLAVAFLLWALGMAVWSRLAARFGVMGDAPRALDIDTHPWNSAYFLSISVIGGALVLLAVIAWTWRTHRSGHPASWAGVSVFAGLALVLIAAFSTRLSAYYTAIAHSGPISTVLPAAVGGWLLAGIGAMAALLAGAALPMSRHSRPFVAGGVVVALVVSATVTVAVARAGDDSRFVDATTAAPVQVPSYPTALGQRKFALTLPDVISGLGPPSFQIWPAGAGFVISHRGAVTAYDAAGIERWHYRRTGPAEPSMSVRVYDNGATVVIADAGATASTRDPLLIGFDAVTGEQLWKSHDKYLAAAFHTKSGLYEADPFLIWRGETTWTRFDARTGKQMWSGDIPTGGCKAFDSFDLPTGLISELSCEHGDLYDYKILVADPQNGGKLWEHTYATDVRLDGDSWYDYTSSLIAANADGVVLDVGSGRPGFDRDLYISPAAQTVVALPPATEAQPSPGPGNTFVVKHYWKQRSVGEVLTVIGPDGHERCTLAPMKASWSNLPDRTESEAGSVSLQDGFVLADSDHHQLRMFSNTTCQPMAQVPFDAIYGLIPAPGVLLAIRQDFPEAPNTAVIEGYAS